MNELPIDPTRYSWTERADTSTCEVPADQIVSTYKIALTRPVRVGRHTLLRTFTVYSTAPRPRIPGTVSTPMNKENETNG